MGNDTLELEAPRFTVKCDGGSDVVFVLKLPFDASGGTHALLVAETADGAAIVTYTSGAGLTIGAYASGVTPITVTIPRAFTLAHRLDTLFFAYHLTLSGLKRAYARGKLVIGGDIT